MINKTGFYNKDELNQLGLKSVGRDVLISVNAKFYGNENISIGDNVRIDDFCVLSGRITIGSHIHIAVSSLLFGGDVGIVFNDFSTISSRVGIYAISDTFSNEGLASPTISDKYRSVIKGEIILEKYTLVGTNATLLPNVTIAEGSVIGAHSIVRKTTEPWYLYYGNPLKKIRSVNRDCIQKSIEFLKEYESNN